MALDFTQDAVFEDLGGVSVQEGVGNEVLLLLDVADWFSQLPLTECLDDGDLELTGGALVLADDAGGCSDIENTIKDAIKDSGQLD